MPPSVQWFVSRAKQHLMPPSFQWLCLCSLFLFSPIETFAVAPRHGVLSAQDLPTASIGLSSPNPIMSRSAFFTSAALGSLAFPSTAFAILQEPSQQSPTETESFSLPFLTALETNSFQESISGFVAGAALATTKTLVKFPLDTVTVRLQVPNSEYSVGNPSRLFKGSYNGLTLSLLSNIPGGGVFFAVKDAAKASLKSSGLTSASPKWLTTTLAVGAALIPYWLVRNPSEVIKVRQQIGLDGYGYGVSAIEAVQLTLNQTQGKRSLESLKPFYTGYWENVLYGLPADVIKFVAYEALTDGRRDLSPLEGAKAGALATATAQLLTTPLDVVRNRVMTAKKADNNISMRPLEEDKKPGYIESLVSLGKEEGFSGLFAGASPRVAKAFLSGAIQFATYEETKQSFTRLLLRSQK